MNPNPNYNEIGFEHKINYIVFYLIIYVDFLVETILLKYIYNHVILVCLKVTLIMFLFQSMLFIIYTRIAAEELLVVPADKY